MPFKREDFPLSTRARWTIYKIRDEIENHFRMNAAKYLTASSLFLLVEGCASIFESVKVSGELDDLRTDFTEIAKNSC